MDSYRVSFYKDLLNSDGHSFKCLQRQIDVLSGRLLRLFDKAMKKDDAVPINEKQHPRDAVARQGGAGLPQAVTHRPAKRHADRPVKLDSHEVSSDRTPFPYIERA